MPLRLDIKRKLSARSDRVKCIDLHSTEPWVLASLYNGNVHIWNFQTQTLLKSFEVCDMLPVRSAKFVCRKQWFVTGSDDNMVRVYNYNTMEKIKTFEAHTDYIRCLAVHPSLPLLLTSSDDMLIKLWDWDKNWTNTQVFEGHTHYVMQVMFNPKDPNTFASASLDRSIKVWGIGSAVPHFTLEGHKQGVNCIDYFTGGEKPYLVSGGDDKTVKIWDYQSRNCLQTLEGHTHNVSCVVFHPELPVIVSGSEDGTVRIWHSNTYRLENTLNYGLERVWSLSCLKGSNKVAIAYDEGTVMIKIGKEVPVASMDSSGKIIWAKHNEIQSANVKTASDDQVVDGERLPLGVKELGSCEVYPQILKHSPNGRLAVVCGDGEYIIYTALAWRNKSFGNALEVVWANDSGEYATRESTSRIKVFKNFKETKCFTPPFLAEGIFGGSLLGVRCGEFICFYDYEQCRLIRRIDVAAKQVYWSDGGDMVVVACDSSFYILKYDASLVSAYLQGDDDNECEDAFELLHEIGERVRTGRWLGDCFVYTNAVGRLNYCVGGEVQTLFHLDRRMYLLGYIPKDNRLYLIDKERNVVSYELLLSILEYKTAVVRGDFASAERILPSIRADQHNSIARFLDAQGLKDKALDLATDPDYKFELAVQLNMLERAHAIVLESESEQKWKQLGDLAISAAKLDLAEECLKRAKDLAGLLLLYSSLGNASGMENLAKSASADGKFNVAFLAFFLLGKLSECIELLCQTGRIPEAAFFARTYMPSEVSRMVALWKEDLTKVNKKAAESLADPTEYANLFPDIAYALKAEKLLRAQREKQGNAAAWRYPEVCASLNRDIIAEIKEREAAGEDFVFEDEVGAAETHEQPAASPKPEEPIASPKEAIASPQPAPSPQKTAPETPTEEAAATPTEEAATTAAATSDEAAVNDSLDADLADVEAELGGAAASGTANVDDDIDLDDF